MRWRAVTEALVARHTSSIGRSRVLGFATATILVISLAGCRFAGVGSSERESLSTFPGPGVLQWATEEGFAGNPKAVAGAKVFAQVGCLNCHTYLGAGSSNLGARDLSAIGKASTRGAEGFAAYVADPSRFGNEVMPTFKDLGRPHLLELGAFLEASKGRR